MLRWFIVMLSIVMLSVATLSVVMLNVFILSVIMPAKIGYSIRQQTRQLITRKTIFGGQKKFAVWELDFRVNNSAMQMVKIWTEKIKMEKMCVSATKGSYVREILLTFKSMDSGCRRGINLCTC